MDRKAKWLMLLVAAATVFSVLGCSSDTVDPNALGKQETPAPADVKALPDSKLPMGGVFGKDPIAGKASTPGKK
jgi:hypothetical protein